MYICLCHGITEKQIRQAVQEGARSVPDLVACLGVATCCGTCSCAAEDVINRARETWAIAEKTSVAH
ncbi:MAG: (2Fe-2S)-binding protein [Betaproteobacteria bacterium]|nr:(2Fe-2S)-binding protein [Betaproteobacteria bacterium]